jgi:hypothetical protein
MEYQARRGDAAGLVDRDEWFEGRTLPGAGVDRRLDDHFDGRLPVVDCERVFGGATGGRDNSAPAAALRVRKETMLMPSLASADERCRNTG